MEEKEFSEMNYDMEYIISEMELKIHQSRIKNPELKFLDAIDKLEKLKKIKFKFYELFWEKQREKKEKNKVKIQNELLLLKTQENETRK